MCLQYCCCANVCMHMVISISSVMQKAVEKAKEILLLIEQPTLEMKVLHAQLAVHNHNARSYGHS